MIKAWKIENIRITPLRGLWAIKPPEERIAIGKIGIACFYFFLEGLLSNIFDLLYLIDAEQGNMSCSRIRQMRIQRPLGFIFQKSVEEGGGVCCVEERFVGRLLPLVSLPLIVLPPPCLFLEMLWFDPQARGSKVHMFEQRKFLGLFTHV